MPIAFDAASGMSYDAGSTLTISHTCSGSDRLLIVACMGFNPLSTFTVTYNGVAMTEIARQALAGASDHFMFYLLNPASGTNNIVITASVGDIRGGGVSYNGVKQSGQPDAFAKGTDSTDPHQVSVTSIADNCWAIVYTGTTGASPTGGDTNTTVRTTVSSNFIGDRNAATTPAGSVTLGSAGLDGTNTALIIATFAPSVSVVGAPKGPGLLMGVGG